MSFVSDNMTCGQYVGGAERTTPLIDGAEAVKRALNLIQRRIEMTLCKHIAFNEVLSAAYMKKQKMTVCGLPRVLAGFLTSVVLVPQRQ